MYMLDTNICIYVLKNRDSRLRNKFKATGALGISSITYAELCFGIENGAAHLRQERYGQLRMFLRRLSIESWGESAARDYRQIRAGLRRQGETIGNNDLLIASHARSTQAILVTNNEGEFSRVPGLQIENWLNQ